MKKQPFAIFILVPEATTVCEFQIYNKIVEIGKIALHNARRYPVQADLYLTSRTLKMTFKPLRKKKT